MLPSCLSSVDLANVEAITSCCGIRPAQMEICSVMLKRDVPHLCFLVGSMFCYCPCGAKDKQGKRTVAGAESKMKMKMLPICDQEDLHCSVRLNECLVVFESSSKTGRHKKGFQAASSDDIFAWHAAIMRAVFLWSSAASSERTDCQKNVTAGRSELHAVMESLVRGQVALAVLLMSGDLSSFGKPLVGQWVRGVRWLAPTTFFCGSSDASISAKSIVSRAEFNACAVMVLTQSERIIAEECDKIISKICDPYSNRTHHHMEEILNDDEVTATQRDNVAHRNSRESRAWAGWVNASVRCTERFAEAAMRRGYDLTSIFWPAAKANMPLGAAVRGWLSTFPIAPFSSLMLIAEENILSRLKRSQRDTAFALSGLRGVSNMGNSCYLNAILQCLSHTPSVARFFLLQIHRLYLKSPLPKENGLSAALGHFVVDMWKYTPSMDPTHAAPVLEAKNVFEALNADCITAGLAPFAYQAQQDAHEALVKLLDCLGGELGGGMTRHSKSTASTASFSQPPSATAQRATKGGTGKTASFIGSSELPCYTSKTLSQGDLIECWWQDFLKRNPHFLATCFAGQTVQTLQCPECNALSYCCDSFMYLFPSFPRVRAKGASEGTPVRLEACLNEIFTDETIDMTGVTCTVCAKTMTKPAVRTLSLHRLPPCLILCVNRTLTDPSGTDTNKCATPLHVPQMLALGPWLSHTTDSTHPRIIAAGGVESVAALDEDVCCRGAYGLYALILHHGNSVNSGHYTAVCCVADTWWHFDDAKVAEIADFDKWIATKASEIYILFYRSRAPEA